MKNSDICKLLIAVDTCKSKNLKVYNKILKIKKQIKDAYELINETLKSIENYNEKMAELDSIITKGKIDGTISIWFDCIIGYGFDSKNIEEELAEWNNKNKDLIDKIVDFSKHDANVDITKLTEGDSESIELIDNTVFSESLSLIIE